MPLPKFIVFLVLSTVLGLFCDAAQAQIIKRKNVSESDSTKADSLLPVVFSNPDTVPAKKDTVLVLKPAGDGFLKSKVHYTADDSIRFDVIEKKVYLFGNADITYEDINLKAARVTIDWNTNAVHAIGVADSTGKMQGEPVFTEGAQSFRTKEITYNFETKKGKIKEVITTEGEGHIHGGVVKKMEDDNYFISKGGYTTCDLDDPHFLIASNKLKVIPNDKVVTGPAYLMIEDVPMPLVLPFGFFPNKKDRTTGMKLPEYGESPSLGFFLKEGGYYFNLGQKMDLLLLGDIYSKGSYGAKAISNYKKRYKYSGNIQLSYASVKEGYKEFPNYSVNNNFFVRWKHIQDPKARPNSTFSADVNAGSRNNFKNGTTSNAQNFLTNTFQSNISWSKIWAGTPFALSASMAHSQNTLNKTVDLTLPQVALTVNRLYPFKKKIAVGKSRWYEKIGTSATLDLKNSVHTADSLFFRTQTFNNMVNGAQLSVPVTTQFKVLKYFNITPTFNSNARLYFQTIRKYWDNETQTAVTDTLQDIRANADYSVNANINTIIYGMFKFKKGKVQALRHVITPNIGFTYRPDFGTEQYGYYGSGGVLTSYSIYNIGYGAPPSGETGSISFSLNNNLEMKVKTPKDTVSSTKKVPIFDVLSIGGSYNFFADSLKLSDFSLSARTTILKAINIVFSSTLTPYVLDSLNRKIDTYRWQAKQGWIKLTTASLAVGFSLNRQGNQQRNSSKGTEAEQNMVNQFPDQFIDFNIPWQFSANYNVTYNALKAKDNVTQAFSFNGNINLTPKWKFGFNSGYDFVAKKLTQTSVNIYRDLHCWQATFNWVPFGTIQSYSIDINVKSSILQDLKLSRKRDWYDF